MTIDDALKSILAIQPIPLALLAIDLTADQFARVLVNGLRERGFVITHEAQQRDKGTA